VLFELLVDTSQRPSVLDQPEENLDNQTVHELFVPIIAEAPRMPQVIAVTHNPNLAVVRDADQIIVAKLSGESFRYVFGAIEEPQINQRMVEILEGTLPGFQNRSDKYIPTSILEAQRRFTHRLRQYRRSCCGRPRTSSDARRSVASGWESSAPRDLVGSLRRDRGAEV
jgi:hypothetical protein